MGQSPMALPLVGPLPVANDLQVPYRWSNIEFGQDMVVSRILALLNHPASAIVQVTEDDRLGWARLLASSLDVAVA